MSWRMASMFSRTSVTMSVLLRPSVSTEPRFERRLPMIGMMPVSPLLPSASPPAPPEKLCGVEPPEKPPVEPAAPASVPEARA